LKKKGGCKISQEMAEIEEKSKKIRASKFRTVEPAVLSSTRATSRVLKVGVKFAHCYHVPVVGRLAWGRLASRITSFAAALDCNVSSSYRAALDCNLSKSYRLINN
jgi:hypothetical protein